MILIGEKSSNQMDWIIYAFEMHENVLFAREFERNAHIAELKVNAWNIEKYFKV